MRKRLQSKKRKLVHFENVHTSHYSQPAPRMVGNFY